LNSLDLTEHFNQFTIYYQQECFQTKLLIQDIWKDLNSAHEPSTDAEVIILEPNADTSMPTEMIVTFAPVIPNPLRFAPNSISLTFQKYDFENESAESWNEEVKLTTTSILAYKFFLLIQEPFVFRP
jgi:hypothetical protein